MLLVVEIEVGSTDEATHSNSVHDSVGNVEVPVMVPVAFLMDEGKPDEAGHFQDAVDVEVVSGQTVVALGTSVQSG